MQGTKVLPEDTCVIIVAVTQSQNRFLNSLTIVNFCVNSATSVSYRELKRVSVLAQHQVSFLVNRMRNPGLLSDLHAF